jgi:putative oxygen-independent coproporphyrinogen III oxidase
VTGVPGIYVHIPFCERKCTYCNFNTTDFFEDLAGRYVNAVRREITYWGEKLGDSQHTDQHCRPSQSERRPDNLFRKPEVDTIYFGGGTPSILQPQQVSSIIETIRTSFDVAPQTEVTLEINPGSFSAPRIKGWIEAGINRASVGVQSFLDRELAALSRTHSAADARATVAALRQSGFDNISVDLIAGLPDQTREDWEYNLAEALRLAPEHLSLYLLEVKEGTQLFGQIKRGTRPRPDEDLAADLYRMICDATSAAGYEQYEISNFALGPAAARNPRSPFRSKHNVKYWTGAAFYGMGCGAHSYDGHSRWANIMKTESYIEAVEARGEAVAERRTLSDEDRASEALFMGLRMSDGVDTQEFRREYEIDILSRYAEELARFAEAGLLDLTEGRLALTRQGKLLSNEVFVAFV